MVVRHALGQSSKQKEDLDHTLSNTPGEKESENGGIVVDLVSSGRRDNSTPFLIVRKADLSLGSINTTF